MDLVFASRENLWDALEQYGEFADGTVCRNYGKHAGRGTRTGDEWGSTQQRVRDQNKAIDRAMFRLRVIAPLQWRLLHQLYRLPGEEGTAAAGWENRGWLKALRYSGLSPTKLDRVSRHTFDVLLDNAVGLLFYAHRVRPHPRS